MSDHKHQIHPDPLKDKGLSAEERINHLQQQVEDNLAGWKKALADYHNLEKDTDKKISQLKDFIQADTIAELLPIFDNYQIALEHVPPNAKKESWVVGLEHTLKLWEGFLADHGVKKITTVGHYFDPHRHESLGMISDAKQKDQVIVEEKQAGYHYGDVVIRPAKVIINNINQ
ncbi:MAG: nucleotide exchange factor GrpE [Parcubacteria group bacterium]|nr:MAG: nucleotide exchange factor GrpE [Parcubacteria group bacterium]